MNDRPSSGQYPDLGYDGLSTTTFAGDSTYASYETQAQTQGQGYNYAYNSYETGAYDTTAWATRDSYAQQNGYLPTIPSQATAVDGSGWGTDTGAWAAPATEYQPTGYGYDTSGEQTGNWAMPGYGTTGTETGAYDATAWNTVAQEELPQQLQPEAAYAYEPYVQHAQHEQHEQHQHHQQYEPFAEPQQLHQHEQHEQPEQAAYEQQHYAPSHTEYAAAETVVVPAVEPEAGPEVEAEDEIDPVTVSPVGAVHDLPTQAMPVTPPAPRAARRAGAAKGGNSRRRTPAKRSALLTVAVPSACVMGVAGVAAASVGGLTGTGNKPGEEVTTLAAPDPASVQPVAANSELDTQLAALSADAGDFADRASRTQERIDLRQRQDEEKKKKAEEAAAKEAARPKFAIPVAQHGLSANFGQAGGMWMSVHTGIDFPVGYGTPVMAATDGTVRTQWNSAYGNMAIVTSPDGTETWYCHLSSTKIRSGKVKAGEVIAYSGNSGNSTGPHLHFEVRPGAGAAIDPLAWLRSHGLDPS
ncbi:peptidoglycan DD-metalloendopeptidase family protein [Streptomyces sp. APSN-46.1]|uniref:M23 family metallopeptidase n=1 Tax=Streptomyces sp. APSN-46.1 TaxID=2929049 RepID=UPI001FB2AA29|nr:M23 family metallopeptidase [Streptomyces sp. APSN-46.1]MCJ1679484.1 peptidoglycan DD-metalloendopeptidase family protein [Streptomyces sp. APSN-46.1]